MSKIWEITRTDHITIRYESIVGERVICEKGKPKIGRKDAVKE